MGLTVSKHVQTDGETVLTLVGECDLGSAEMLRELIRSTIIASPQTPLTVDLDQVEFLDSSGISVLLDGTGLANRLGCSYRVVNPRGMVLQVLEIVGVLDRLNT